MKERKPREKITEARYFSMRLNPKTSREDAATIEILDRLIKGEKYTFKAIAQDAILFADGRTPEMFYDSTLVNQRLVSQFEDMLSRFADDLLKQLKAKGVRLSSGDGDEETEESDTGISKNARNFARGFLQRQGSGSE